MQAAVEAVMGLEERLAQVGLVAAVMLLDLAMELRELLTQAAVEEDQTPQMAAMAVQVLSSSRFQAPTPQPSPEV